MKKLMGLLVGLAMLAPGTCLAQSLTAAQILAKVAETYRNLHSFRSVVAGRIYHADASTASYGKWSGGLPTDVAESRPGKVRVSNKNFLLVSDGESTWTYLPGQGEYQEVEAAPLLQENWRFCPHCPFSGLDYVWIFAHPVPPGYHARLRGQGALTAADGRKIDCYVITGPVISRFGPVKDEGASEEVWVDKSLFIVRRDQFNMGWVAETTEQVRMDGEIGLEPALEYLVGGVSPGPVPEETFKFHPPAGAKRVESMGKYTIYPYYARISIGTRDIPEASLSVEALGQKGPDFTLQDLDGKTFRLSGLRGKTVVLDFWASWCKRCEGELAAVQKLHDELASKGVVFFGIDDESPETVKSFAKDHGYTFPILLDSNQAVHQLYDVRWAPTTVVINRKGKIAAQYIGAGGEAQLLSALKKAGLRLPAASARK